MQPRQLQCCIWRDSIKLSLRFSWFCMFFVSKGNPFWLLFYSRSLPEAKKEEEICNKYWQKPTAQYTIAGYSWIQTKRNCNRLTAISKASLFKFTETFTTKKWKFSDKNSDIFHISAKNILWVLVRTASPRRFQRVPTIYVFEQK